MRIWHVVVSIALTTPLLAQDVARSEWPAYGRDPGGSRFSPLTQITRDNVARLTVAWTYHTGEPQGPPRRGREPALEVTPIVVDGTMYIITPMGRVLALDPATGRERWRYEAIVNRDAGFGDFASRGVSHWRDNRAPSGALCATRIFAATIDARLVSLDAASGALCRSFGQDGVVNLRTGLRQAPFEFQAYQHTSPPAVVGDIVVTGSAIADNSWANPASGEIRGWDARTGALRWTFDPVPQIPTDPAFATWKDGSAKTSGAANAWSVIVADPARDLIFVPTSSPGLDYVGKLRLGDNRHANSVVALRASTGRLVWAFQTVHHDLWDYDNAPPPALATVTKNGARIPAVLQATKTGMLFVLNRETGEPIHAVVERAVPASDVPGEQASPTQPFTAVTPPLSSHRVTAEDVWAVNETDRAACLTMITSLRNEGIFTPPSLRGTLTLPSNIGGAHWGGVAVHEALGVALVPVNRFPSMVQLIPDTANIATLRAESTRLGLDYEYTRMNRTGYWMRRRILRGPSGLPCTKPPWGSLVAVNLTTGALAWDVPLGNWPMPPGVSAPPTPTGTPNMGGPIVTASGVAFIGATLDRKFRAFDVASGRELWSVDIPAGARATPMTYEAAGRQYVVIAAGGGGAFGSGDAIIAFALPQGAH